MNKREKDQVKRQVESARKLLRNKSPRIDNAAAAPLIEFINQHIRERPKDWLPDADEFTVALAQKRDAAKPRKRPPRHPLGISYPVGKHDVKR